MVESLDPDRRLALSYVPRESRESLGALWSLDTLLGTALRGGGNPMIGRIKLAWWREALEALDHRPPPAEPVLQGLAAHVLPAGIPGVELAAMETGWSLLFEPELGAEPLAGYAAARGGELFRLSARLLEPGAAIDAAPAGEAWALVDLARHSSNAADRAGALAAAGQRLDRSRRWPRRLRPLAMLAALAARDVARGPGRWEAPGAPGRMLRMLGVALIGR